jgi:hypothetical protein
LGRGGEGGVGGVTGAFFFLGAAFLPFAIFAKMGARGFSSSVGGADERPEESESSMMRRRGCFVNAVQSEAGARLLRSRLCGES